MIILENLLVVLLVQGARVPDSVSKLYKLRYIYERSSWVEDSIKHRAN